MDEAKLPSATLGELLELQTGYAEGVASLKRNLDAVKAELARRYASSAKQALDQQDKTHGTVTLGLQDGFAAKCDVKQSVKWDSAKLMGIAQSMPWDAASALFKIEFSMAEAVYKNVADPALKAKLDAARTTKLAEPVVTLTREG